MAEEVTYDVKKLGPWDYEKNRTNMLAYWRQPLEENGKYEGIYTAGLRGIHDSGMPGGGTAAEKVARLQRVIEDQRTLLEAYEQIQSETRYYNEQLADGKWRHLPHDKSRPLPARLYAVCLIR